MKPSRDDVTRYQEALAELIESFGGGVDVADDYSRVPGGSQGWAKNWKRWVAKKMGVTVATINALIIAEASYDDEEGGGG